MTVTRRKKTGKSAKKSTEEIIYEKLLIVKTSNQNYDRETFIVDSVATSHIIKLEENMMNLKDAETQVIVGYSRTLTGGGMMIGVAIRDVI